MGFKWLRPEGGSWYELLIKQGTDGVTYLNGSVLAVDTVELGYKVMEKKKKKLCRHKWLLL